MDNRVEIHYLLKVRKSPSTCAVTVPIVFLYLLCTLNEEIHWFSVQKQAASSNKGVSEPAAELLEDELVLEGR